MAGGVAKADANREGPRSVGAAVRRLAPAGSVNRGPAPAPTVGKLTAASVMTPEASE